MANDFAHRRKMELLDREQGRAVADNLRQLIERGDDPIEMLARFARRSWGSVSGSPAA